MAEHKETQDEALLKYRVTGVKGNFVDPTADQEPDIAEEEGVHPHPEMANPAPPKENEGKLGLGVSYEAKYAARGGPAVKNVAGETDSVKSAADRPDLRGNEVVNDANAKDSEKSKNKS